MGRNDDRRMGLARLVGLYDLRIIMAYLGPFVLCSGVAESLERMVCFTLIPPKRHGYLGWRMLLQV